MNDRADLVEQSQTTTPSPAVSLDFEDLNEEATTNAVETAPLSVQQTEKVISDFKVENMNEKSEKKSSDLSSFSDKVFTENVSGTNKDG